MGNRVEVTLPHTSWSLVRGEFPNLVSLYSVSFFCRWKPHGISIAGISVAIALKRELNHTHFTVRIILDLVCGDRSTHPKKMFILVHINTGMWDVVGSQSPIVNKLSKLNSFWIPERSTRKRLQSEAHGGCVHDCFYSVTLLLSMIYTLLESICCSSPSSQ